MPATTLKIEHARFALTLDPDRRIIQDASILIEGQRIARVGKAADLAGVSADRVIDGRRFLVTPGFFNGHMHISYAHAVRGIFPDDLANRLFHVFNLQSAMTEEEEYLTTLLGILELLQNGTTTFLDPGTTRFPDACFQAYQDSGIRVVWSECVTDQPAPVKLPRFPAAEAVQRSAAFIDKWHGKLDGRMLAQAMAFSCETASGELLQGLKRLVDERGVSLTLHHQSGVAERKRYHEAHGTTPTEYLEQLGVLGPNVMLAHVLGLNAAEVAAIARTGTNVVMCPTSAMKEAKGLHLNGNLPEFVASGVNVAFGSDSANSSNHLDVIRSVNLAALQYKDARQDLAAIPAETALEMGTLTAAKAFGMAEQVGSIEAGKKADLVLFDTPRPEWQALFNPINNLVYSADAHSVHTVIVDGRVVVENYRQTFVDEDQLIDRVQEIGESLQARTGITFPRSRWPIV
jgi:cytosine/adenosine deaminase-related metal-dependent hydrolase